MNRLPVLRTDDEQATQQLGQAVIARRRTELAVFEHHLEARYLAECERIDAQALSDVVRTSVEEELSVFDWGMEQAAGSAIKAELVSRKVVMQSRINSARIMRRFGM